MSDDAKSVFLRASLRGGYLTEEARREAVQQLYHHERARDGMPDGIEYWAECEVTW